MGALKLERLPDRTPVKITVLVPPELHRALLDYAEAYAAAYARPEPVEELVPAMLDAFLKSDRQFARARRSRGATD